MTWEKLLPLLWDSTVETLYMTFWSSLIAYVVGLPLGVLLVVTRKGGIMPAPTFNTVLGVAINFLRSIPFIIMLAVLFPVTRLVIGRPVDEIIGLLKGVQCGMRGTSCPDQLARALEEMKANA